MVVHSEKDTGLAKSLNPSAQQRGTLHLDRVDPARGGDEGFDAEGAGPALESSWIKMAECLGPEVWGNSGGTILRSEDF